jgi:hypothetical protein
VERRKVTDITITLTAEEAVFIANVLGNLPTQSNAHPLWLKVVAQVQPHLQPADNQPAEA